MADVPEPRPVSTARATAGWTAIAVAGVLAFYLWTVASIGRPWGFGQEQRDYYNLLIDGYLEGQLHMKVEVPEAMLRLADPYDPAQRPPGVGLHDASFYRGRYYVYFGAAPMVVLMLPYRLLTGSDLPLPVATLVFVSGAFLTSVGLWLAIRRRYFPDTPPFVAFVGGLVLGLAGGGPVLLRRPDMWELPIAGGACFALLSLACLWRGLQSPRAGRWLAASALCLGLAVASRPTYLVATPLFLVPWIVAWRRERRLPWPLIAACVAPLAGVGALMAWHNQARFGDPLQFGQAYQLSLDYESKLPHFRAAYVPYTARTYFFAPAKWSPYFPFLHRGDAGHAPRGFTQHRGDVYGLLRYVPLAWLALLAPLAVTRRREDERGPLAAWLAAATWLALGVTTLLLFFFSALARYASDFVPVWILLAGVGLLVLERWLAPRRPWIRWFGRAGWGAAAVLSIAFSVLFSLVFDGLLQEHNPALAREVARTLNRIPATFERLRGVEYGPVEFTFRWDEPRATGRATVLTRGTSPAVDRVFVVKADGDRVQWGVALSDGPELLGEPTSLAPGRPHRVRVTLGSLLPPAEHPFFAGWSDDAVRRASRAVRLEVDGQAVLEAWRRRGELSSRELHVGSAAPPAAGFIVATGQISDVRRVALTSDGVAFLAAREQAAEALARAGGVKLRLKRPSGRTGQAEPLVVTGRTGAGDMVMIQYVDDRTVRFAHDQWGAPLVQSDPVILPAGEPHTIGLRFPALPAVRDATLEPGTRTGPLQLTVDGITVWEAAAHFHPTEGPEIALGVNPIGGTSCGPRFSGEILAAEPWTKD